MDDPHEEIVAVGLTPIYFSISSSTRHHLDQVSSTRPIYIQYASGHLAINTAAMLRRMEFGDSASKVLVGTATMNQMVNP